MPAGLIQRNARGVGSRYRCIHQPLESAMTLDTIMVVIAVTMMFATLAVVLGWAERKTRLP
jgi:hypothetical protein